MLGGGYRTVNAIGSRTQFLHSFFQHLLYGFPGSFPNMSLAGAQKSIHPELHLLRPLGLRLPTDIAQWGEN